MPLVTSGATVRCSVNLSGVSIDYSSGSFEMMRSVPRENNGTRAVQERQQAVNTSATTDCSRYHKQFPQTDGATAIILPEG